MRKNPFLTATPQPVATNCAPSLRNPWIHGPKFGMAIGKKFCTRHDPSIASHINILSQTRSALQAVQPEALKKAALRDAPNDAETGVTPLDVFSMWKKGWFCASKFHCF